MTTPQLPWGSTTQGDLAEVVVMPAGLGSALQDQSASKFQGLTSGRFPGVMRGTSAGDPAMQAGPLGFIVDLVAQFMSTVSNADPESIARPEDLHALVTDFVEDLPLVGELISLKDAMMGVYDGDDPIFQFIQNLFAPLRKLLELASGVSGIPSVGQVTSGWSSLWDDIQADFGELLSALQGGYSGSDPILQLIQQVTTPLRIILDPRGLIRSGLIPSIGVGQITDELLNLVAEHDFSAAITIDPGQAAFYWDGAHGRTAPGCAAVDGDGTTKSLTMVSQIPVSQGQRLEVSAWVAWQWVTGPAVDGVRLRVDTYAGGVPVSSELIGAVTADGTQPVWQQIIGQWTVPAGVDGITVRLEVTAALADGTVRFDDVSVVKIQKLALSWVEGLTKRFEALAALFGITDLDLDGVIDAADIWNALWNGILKALNWIPNVAQSTIDQIVNAFENLGELVDQNLPFTRILESIFGIFDTGLLANSRISEVETQLRQLASDANAIVDGFDGAASSNLGPSWAQSYSGGGAGNLGRDGKGNAVWRPSGFGNRTCIARYTASSLDTDSCFLSAQLASSPQSYIFDDAYTYLCWRMNTSGDGYYRLRIGYDSVRVQKVVAGSAANVGAAWSGSPKGGNVIDVAVGGPGGSDPGRIVVRRNQTTILDVVDPSPVYGAGYRHVGIGMETGNRLVLSQNIPAGLAVFTALEVL